MSAAIMNHTRFAGGDLRDVNAYGALFSGADFSGANLTNASFVGAYLQGANLRGARLDGRQFLRRGNGPRRRPDASPTQRRLRRPSTRLPRGLHVKGC